MRNRKNFVIDITNPGHFFACCGILYCADRMFDLAEGCFEKNKFVLETDCKNDSLEEIINRINSYDLDSIKLDTDKSDSPLYLDNIPIRLDFWNHFDDRPKIKLFAGQEKSDKIVLRWMEYLKKCDKVKELLDFSVTDVPSGFDINTSWNTLDVGFSLNEQKMGRKSYPLVEFFAYIGIQTYSWERKKGRSLTYRYRTWSIFLPITVSKAIAAGALTLSGSKCFEFYTEKTGQKKILSKAKEITL